MEVSIIGSVVLTLRPLVSNSAAGMLIESRPAFSVGDEIVTDGYTGEVMAVTARSTVIRTRDWKRVHIPNTDVLSGPVVVLTALGRRRSEIELDIGAVEVSFGRAMASLLLGAVIGLAARGIIELIRLAERYSSRGLPWVRGLAAGVSLAGLFAVGRLLTGENVAITSGFPVIDWALEPDHAIALLVAVLLVRMLGTSVAIGGGGAGGLFVPLIATGAIVGRIFADVGNAEDLTMFVMVGGATMFGASYAAPLTGVIIAELTGQPGLIVPSLLATTIAMLTVGNRSVSHAQRSGSDTNEEHEHERVEGG